jgi:Swiss Army Knife protein, DSP-PTPase phosphatase domain
LGSTESSRSSSSSPTDLKLIRQLVRVPVGWIFLGTGGLFLRKLRAKVADEPTGFVWVEKGRVAASGFPASRGQLEWLVGNGINSVLTLTPNALPPEWVEDLPLVVDHVPMDDHKPPEQQALDRCARYVQGQVKEGRAVLVHCLAGEGRTGCVLAAYIIRDRGIGAAEALEALREAKPAFVEWSQEKAIFEYAENVKR